MTTKLTRALDGVPGASAVRGSSMSGMAYVDVVFGNSSRRVACGRRAIVRSGSAAPRRRRSRRPPGSASGPRRRARLGLPVSARRTASHGQTALQLRRLQDERGRSGAGVNPRRRRGGLGRGRDRGGCWSRSAAGELQARGAGFSATWSRRCAAAAAGRTDSDGARRDPLGARRRARRPARPRESRDRDVARVRIGHAMPNGLADLAGLSSAVGGIVIAETRRRSHGRHRGASGGRSSACARTLPTAVRLVTVYDRSELATRVERTLLRALGEEIAVVVLVILIFLLHARSALMPLMTLPLVLLLTFAAMRVARRAGHDHEPGRNRHRPRHGRRCRRRRARGLPSPAGESCRRSASPGERRRAILAAAGSFAPAILTSLLHRRARLPARVRLHAARPAGCCARWR